MRRRVGGFISLVFALGMALASESADIDVVAVYYPHWHQYPKGTEWFGAAWDEGEWAFVKTAVPRYPGHRVPMVPLAGYLKGNDPKDVAAEIELASGAGINVFLYDYYYYGGKVTQEEAIEEGFLQAENRQLMKFALMWCYHDRRDQFRPPVDQKNRRLLMRLERTPEEFLGLIDFAIARYFNRPEYWRKDGKLFFSIFGGWDFIPSLGKEKAAQALQEARRRVAAAGLGEIHFNIQGLRPDQHDLAREVGFDSMTDYNVVPRPGPDSLMSYEDQMKASRERWAQHAKGSLPYMPVVTTGWDCSARCALDAKRPWHAAGYPYVGIVTNSTPEKFEALLRDAKRYVENDPKGINAVYINAWNEYTECPGLLPTVQDGDAMLRAVARVFGGEPQPAIDRSVDSLNRVDPLIGTEEIAGLGANYGGLQPMAGVPFGSMNLVPMTRTNGVARVCFCSNDRELIGFALTRQPAIWMGEWGAVYIRLPRPLPIESVDAHPHLVTVKAGGRTYELTASSHVAYIRTDDESLGADLPAMGGTIERTLRTGADPKPHFRCDWVKRREGNVLKLAVSLLGSQQAAANFAELPGDFDAAVAAKELGCSTTESLLDLDGCGRTGALDVGCYEFGGVVPEPDPEPIVLGTPTVRPSTNYNGSAVMVSVTGDFPAGAAVSAKVTIAGGDYAGTVKDGVLSFAIPDTVVTAGNVYAGTITLTVGNEDYTKAVTLAQGTLKLDEKADWIVESAAAFAATGTWGGDRAEPVGGTKIAVSNAVFTAATPSPVGAKVSVTTVVNFQGATERPFDPAMKASVQVVEVANVNRYAFLTGNGAVTNLTAVANVSSESTVKIDLDYTADTVTYTVDGTAFGPFVAPAADTKSVSCVCYDGETEVTSLVGSYRFEGLDANLAKVGGVEYATVAEAIAKAGSDTVQLLWDASWEPSAAGEYAVATNDHFFAIGGPLAWSVTDNGNGTLTVTVTGGTSAPGAASITVVGKSVTVVVKDARSDLWYALEKTTDLSQPFVVVTEWTKGAEALSAAVGDGETQGFYRVVTKTAIGD